jgi:hypothetical protein
MRRRPAVILMLAALFSTLFIASLPSAHASGAAFAQEDASENSDQGDESDAGSTDEDEGSGSTEAEVGSNEGQTETAEEETGPPWTYQMARMSAALIVLLALTLGFLYWRLVIQRQRRGI